jgi:hypothetical protein
MGIKLVTGGDDALANSFQLGQFAGKASGLAIEIGHDGAKKKRATYRLARVFWLHGKRWGRVAFKALKPGQKISQGSAPALPGYLRNRFSSVASCSSLTSVCRMRASR